MMRANRWKLVSGDLELELFADEGGNVGVGEKSEKLEDVNYEFFGLLSSLGSASDYREPSLLIVGPDGCFSRRFALVDVKEALPPKGILPVSRNAKSSLCLVYEDDRKEVRIQQYISSFAESVFSFRLFIENISEGEIRIKKAASLEFPLKGKDYRVLSFLGAWARERIPNETILHGGSYVQQSLAGISSSFVNPWILVGKEKRYYGFNLLYSGNHKESVEVSHLDNTKVEIGINDFALDIPLKKGALFEAPEALMSYGESPEEVSLRFAPFIRNNILPQGKKDYIVYNTWEGSGWNIPYATWKPLAEKAARLGCEVFLFDDGWYHHRSSERADMGDYSLDQEKMGGDFPFIRNELSSLGLKMGLWIEPEMIGKESELAKRHPEFILRHPKSEPVLIRYQYLLDLAKQEARDYLFDELSSLIRDSGASYIKWDFNRLLTDIYSPKIPAGAYFHEFILGYYRLIDALTEAFPAVSFEGCASGGARFDLGTLAYVSSIWTSDNTDPRSRLFIQEGTASGYPLAAISNHYSGCPNVTTGRFFLPKSRLDVALFGRFGVEMDLMGMDEGEFSYLQEGIAYYKQRRDFIAQADFFPLNDLLEKESKAWCLSSPARDHFLLLLANLGQRRPKKLPLPFLEEGKRYAIKERDGERGVLSGEKLQEGLPFPAPSEEGLSTYLYEIEVLP